nr:hypothetical protein [Tanacetum cinerariifolium]
MGNASNNALFASKPKTPLPPKKDNPAKVAICHQCGEVGHWRRNCPVYLAELMKKKKLSQGASTLGIFTIGLYSFPSKSWIYDTGCGIHICITGLRGSKKLKPGALSLYVGDGHRATVEAIATYHLELPSGLVIVLNNYHYAPSITRGVISVLCCFDNGFINRFVDNNVISVLKNNLVYFMAVPRDGIFEIYMSCSNKNNSSMFGITIKRAQINLDSSLLWRCRLGHISKKRIEKLQHDGLLNSIDIESLGKCFSCMSGKMARKPYSHQVERAKYLLGLIYTDVYGPFKILSRQGANYFVTFTNDFSRYGYVYLLKRKHEVFETFKVFQKEVENQLGKTISHYVLIVENAEFFKSKLLDLKASGSVEDLELIQKEDTNPSVDTSLNHEEDDQETDEPHSHINPIRKSSRTRRAPDHMCLYIDVGEHELEDLGKPANYKAALQDPESKKWLDAMNVKMQSMKDNDVWVLVELPPNARTVDDQETDEPHSHINPIRKSSRTRRAPDHMCLYINDGEHELEDLGKPANYKAALQDPKSKKWLDAMNVKMQSMKDNDVWVLVELPPNARTVGSKWLFKKKTDMDGAIYIFKARLVTKGFTQAYVVDYEETFSPVVDIRAIGIVIAIAAYYDYEIWQMDVKTAFLNGHLSEEVYTKQPEGFVNPKYPSHVCKRKHSIYGLKQASRQWNKRFDDDSIRLILNISSMIVIKWYGEDKLKLKELMELSTKLSDRVLDFENIKTAQAKEIANLKKKVKKLERKRRSRTPWMNLFKIGTSKRRSLSEKDASKQGMNLK